MTKLAVLGTNYFQIDLLERARRMGLETHMFGITEAKDARGRRLDLAGVPYADHYHPVSILDTEAVVRICREENVAGVLSVGSDLAVPCMCGVATALGLQSNGPESGLWSTNKHEMRRRFAYFGVPQPRWLPTGSFKGDPGLGWPLMAKAVDRSGKLGIVKVNSQEELDPAMAYAHKGSLASDVILLEEYIGGKEYTCESVSWQGRHTILTWTEKWSGPPHFVEEMHLQPAKLPEDVIRRTTEVVCGALDALGIVSGPSHVEFKFDSDGEAKVIEVAARVVGDSIWSAVEITTGVNWIDAAIDVALGRPPDLSGMRETGDYGAVKFVLTQADFARLEGLRDDPRLVRVGPILEEFNGREMAKNGDRYGYYVVRCGSREEAVELTGSRNQ